MSSIRKGSPLNLSIRGFNGGHDKGFKGFGEEQGLESTYFEWESFEEGDNFSDMQFFNCKLLRQIGPFKKGTRFDVIEMINSQSIIRLIRCDLGDENAVPECLFIGQILVSFKEILDDLEPPVMEEEEEE